LDVNWLLTFIEVHAWCDIPVSIRNHTDHYFPSGDILYPGHAVGICYSFAVGVGSFQFNLVGLSDERLKALYEEAVSQEEQSHDLRYIEILRAVEQEQRRREEEERKKKEQEGKACGAGSGDCVDPVDQ
jgi:hypothetical protein